MNEVYKTRAKISFPGKPSGISERGICAISGDIADKGCPAKKEYFIQGTEPGVKCDGLHGKLSNIKELITREKKTMNGKNAPKIFEKNDDGNKREMPENNSEQSFFFDD